MAFETSRVLDDLVKKRTVCDVTIVQGVDWPIGLGIARSVTQSEAGKGRGCQTS